MERFGIWYNKNVYKITHADYVKYKYYEPDGKSAFWIIDNNLLVVDNIIAGKVCQFADRVILDDEAKEAGSTYYWTVNNVVKVKERAEEQSEADRILSGVYSAKLWDEI